MGFASKIRFAQPAMQLFGKQAESTFDDDLGIGDDELNQLATKRRAAQRQQQLEAENTRLAAENKKLKAGQKKTAAGQQQRERFYSALNQSGPIRLAASRGICPRC